MTDYPKTLAEAVAILQTQLPEIKRSELAVVPTKAGGSYEYTYADLANISQEILPILGKLGLSFIATPTLNTNGQFVLAYKLLHVSSEYVSGEYPLDGGTPQARGSSITYARRYCLCATTGLAPEKDDDAAAAQAEVESKRGTVQRRPVAHPPPRTVGEGRTVQRAAKPPLPGETPDPLADDLRHLHILLTNLGITKPADRGDWMIKEVGRPLKSSKELTAGELSTLIERADEKLAAQDMGGADNDVDKGTDTPPNTATETV